LEGFSSDIVQRQEEGQMKDGSMDTEGKKRDRRKMEAWTRKKKQEFPAISLSKLEISSLAEFKGNGPLHIIGWQLAGRAFEERTTAQQSDLLCTV
jgi:hypothetical protein